MAKLEEIQSTHGYAMVSSRGHIWLASARTLRKDVVAFADDAAFHWSWAKAKKDGWQIIKVEIRALDNRDG